MEMDREASDENGEVKVDAGETGEAERDGDGVESIHGAISDRDSGFHVQSRERVCASGRPLIFQAMLDIRLIREQPDFVKSRLATRGGDDAAKIDEVLRVDADRRRAETALQQCNADRKRLSKEIGGKRAKGEATDEIEGRVREIGNEIARLSEQSTEFDQQQSELLLGIPNLPNETAPVGKDPSENPVIRSWGEKPKLKEAQDHVALGTKLKLFDLERAAKLSGSGFICFTGAGARLERALIQFMLDLHAREHGYLEVSTPFVVRRDCMIGTTQ